MQHAQLYRSTLTRTHTHTHAHMHARTHTHTHTQLDDVQSARYLIAFGCEVNCVNPNNSTPVDIAQELHPDGDILAFLVSVGGKTGLVQVLYNHARTLLCIHVQVHVDVRTYTFVSDIHT